MRVVATAEFLGVPDGAVYGRPIQPGEELFGNLAQVALRDGLAKEAKAPKPKPAEGDAGG
jgi:hypothetical protein